MRVAGDYLAGNIPAILYYRPTDRQASGGTRIPATSDEQGRSCRRLTAAARFGGGPGRRSVKTLPPRIPRNRRSICRFAVGGGYSWAQASRWIDTRRKTRRAYVCGHDDFRTRSLEVSHCGPTPARSRQLSRPACTLSRLPLRLICV